MEGAAAELAAIGRGRCASAVARRKHRHHRGRRLGRARPNCLERARRQRAQQRPVGASQRRGRIAVRGSLCRARAGVASVCARLVWRLAGPQPARPSAFGGALARRLAQPATATAQRQWRSPCHRRHHSNARRHPVHATSHADHGAAEYRFATCARQNRLHHCPDQPL